MKRYLLMLIAGLYFLNLAAQHQLDWVNVPHMENGLVLWMDGIVVDPAGDIYTRQNKYTHEPLDTNTRYYQELVRQDPFGNVLWEKQIGNLWLPEANYQQVMVENSGYIYTPCL